MPMVTTTRAAPSSRRSASGAPVASRGSRRSRPLRRITSGLLCCLLLALLVSLAFAPVAAQDPFPVLVDASHPVEVPSAQRPGWVYVNAGSEAGAVVRVVEGQGASERVVAEARSRPAHDLLFVPAVNGTPAAPDADVTFSLRTAGPMWLAWVPEARLLRPVGDGLFVPCLEEHPVAYLWSVSNGTGTLVLDETASEAGSDGAEGSTGTFVHEGLEVFVFSAQPFRMVLQRTANVTYEGRMVDGGADAFWVVARPAPGPCRDGIELRFLPDRIDDGDAASPFFWLFLIGGLLIVSFIVFARPPRGRVGPSKGSGLRPRSSVATASPLRTLMGLLLVAVLVQALGGAAAGHGGGFEVLTLPQDGSLASVDGVMGGERVLCAQAPEVPANVMYRAERGRDTIKAGGLQLAVAPDHSCVSLPEADRYTFQVQSGAEQGVQAFVAPGPMTEMQRPGSVPVLDPPGRFLIVPEVRERARLASLTEDPWRVHVIDPRTFDVVAEGDISAQETELVARGEAGDAEGTPLWIVVTADQEPNGRSAHVAWDDPDWFPTSPSFGEIAVVVVAALLIVLYKGRPRQDRLRRYGSEAAEEARRRGDRGPFGEDATTS